MRFDHGALETAVAGWHGRTTIEPLAWWQNYRFEGRVSAGRKRHFEAFIPVDIDENSVQEWHNAYIAEHVNLAVHGRMESRPFQPGNDLARLPPPDGSEVLVRIEDLSGWCLDLFHGGQAELAKAFEDGDATFAKFLVEMNAKRGKLCPRDIAAPSSRLGVAWIG